MQLTRSFLRKSVLQTGSVAGHPTPDMWGDCSTNLEQSPCFRPHSGDSSRERMCLTSVDASYVHCPSLDRAVLTHSVKSLVTFSVHDAEK